MDLRIISMRKANYLHIEYQFFASLFSQQKKIDCTRKEKESFNWLFCSLVPILSFVCRFSRLIHDFHFSIWCLSIAKKSTVTFECDILSSSECVFVQFAYLVHYFPCISTQSISSSLTFFFPAFRYSASMKSTFVYFQSM